MPRLLAPHGSEQEGRMARYIVRATNDSGPVEFSERLTIDAALAKARELEAADFRHITIVNVQTGVEITDLESIIPHTDES